MGAFTRRSSGAKSCFMGLMTVSVAVLVMSIDIVTVQAQSAPKEDEIEAYLNRVNKPAVKSIVIENGDIIDCVDIYKQPAFDHPLLKDHKIIKAPSFVPKMGKTANATRESLDLKSTLQRGVDCPEGTIPIRRTRRSDLIHAKSLEAYGTLNAVNGTIERTAVLEHGRYIGVTGVFNVWRVPEVEDNEFSHAFVEISDAGSFIEAGWLVNPALYGDKKTRTYAYWTADGYGTTGCYNLVCPGFVQVSRKVVLGSEIWPLSVIDGDQMGIRVSIYKDVGKMAWWLMLQDVVIGYWPIRIFENGGKFVQGTTTRWAGGILNTMKKGQHTITDMGNGHFPEGYRRSAFINDWKNMVDPVVGFRKPTLYRSYADRPTCYNVNFADSDKFIFFGGPGLGARQCY